MFARNQRIVPAALFEGFKKKDNTPEAIDEFRSALIIAYEQAIEDGISPNAALAAALDWLSLELKRCAGVDHADG